MNSVDAPQETLKPWLGVFWGGLACGVLDITSALVGYGLRGVPPMRIFQSVAAGALGRTCGSDLRLHEAPATVIALQQRAALANLTRLTS